MKRCLIGEDRKPAKYLFQDVCLEVTRQSHGWSQLGRHAEWYLLGGGGVWACIQASIHTHPPHDSSPSYVTSSLIPPLWLDPWPPTKEKNRKNRVVCYCASGEHHSADQYLWVNYFDKPPPGNSLHNIFPRIGILRDNIHDDELLNLPAMMKYPGSDETCWHLPLSAHMWHIYLH